MYYGNGILSTEGLKTYLVDFVAGIDLTTYTKLSKKTVLLAKGKDRSRL